nr:thioredoxin [uncultured bacterium]
MVKIQSFCTFDLMRNNLFKILLLIFILISCSDDMKNGNNLKNESSPYLLQHVENPVNWNPWDKKYLKQAKKENKLVIISIGYASCHWCHVMERESFQDLEVAELMNEKFISIKVDREERPDIDQVYMNAIQLITGNGGWPLNVITLPDGRPIWGGTYFSKEQWSSALKQISELYESEPEKFISYAERVQEGINSLNVVESKTNSFENVDLSKYSESLLEDIDEEYGGFKGAPKFIMPNNLEFLLRYSVQKQQENSKNKILKSLNMMAYGGIFDHVDGGFSRYSTDERWHVPHFEKMLYDNGQLMSLYSVGYRISKSELYKKTIYKIHEYINAEMKDFSGGYYSSLDADSKLEDGSYAEGEYYTWRKEELEKIIQDNFDLFTEYFNVNEYGFWEEENKYILTRTISDEEFIKKNNLQHTEFNNIKSVWLNKLKIARKEKKKPGLDYKIITSWNGLMISGYVNAYKAINDEVFMNEAISAGEFIYSNLVKKDGGLFHNYVNGQRKINGYLEDYAMVIQASLDLYEITLNQLWIERALKLSEYVIDNFSSGESELFYFTSKKDEDLISRSVEFRDNVIPSSNSIMAKNLFRLYHYFDKEEYYERSKNMSLSVTQEFEAYPSGYSNWFDLIYNLKSNYYEVAVVGENALEKVKQINSKYIPNKLIIGSTSENNLPLLKNRFIKDKTLIYVCINKACKMPTESVEESVSLINY